MDLLRLLDRIIICDSQSRDGSGKLLKYKDKIAFLKKFADDNNNWCTELGLSEVELNLFSSQTGFSLVPSFNFKRYWLHKNLFVISNKGTDFLSSIMFFRSLLEVLTHHFDLSGFTRKDLIGALLTIHSYHGEFVETDGWNQALAKRGYNDLNIDINKIDRDELPYDYQDVTLEMEIQHIKEKTEYIKICKKDFKITSKRFDYWSDPKLFVSSCKYVTAYPLAKFMHNLLPPQPIGFKGNPLIFSGKMYQKLRSRLTGGAGMKENIIHKPNKKNLSLWLSYLQGIKRGSNTVDDDFVLTAYEKHGEIISRPPVDRFTDLDEDQFKKDFGRKAKVFCYRFNQPVPRLLEATGSSSLGTTRQEGGARERIRDVVSGRIKNSYYNNNLKFVMSPWHVSSGLTHYDAELLEELIPEDYEPEVSGTHPGEVFVYKTDSYKLVLDHVERTVISENLHAVMPTSAEELTYLYGVSPPSFKEALDIAKTEPPVVQVIAVREPLKVRMISKGPSFRYWISRFFQKAMWNHLQSFDCFALTGEVLGIHHLNGLVIKAQKLDFKFDNFVSGDYSSATDLLDINFTKLCFESFLRRCDYSSDLADVLRSVLYNQEITYPHFTGVKSFVQKNGQLMGSTLSFPILCMVNLICFWMAFEEYSRRTVSIHELPVLVNGDDILFPTDQGLYNVWLKYVKYVGFELSIGKNYIHPTVLTVNSQCFVYNYNLNNFEKIKFLNVGLLTGLSKKGGGISGRALQPLDSLYNEVIGDSPNPQRSHNRFLFHYKDIIEKHTKVGSYTLNLFAHQNYGGLGFVNDHIDPKFTQTQRLFAALNERQYKQGVAAQDMKSCDRFKIIKKVDSAYKLVKKNTKVLALQMKTTPLAKGVKPYEQESIKIDPLVLMKTDLFNDGEVTSVMSHPKISKKILENGKEGEKLYPIKSDNRLKSWPYQTVILPYTQTELPFIGLDSV